MKARLLRDCIKIPDGVTQEQLDEFRAKRNAGEITNEDFKAATEEFAPKGTIIDHPDAWKLVKLGQAEPADEECEKRADMTPEQIEAAFAAQQKLLDGQALHPSRNASPEGVRKTDERRFGALRKKAAARKKAARKKAAAKK